MPTVKPGIPDAGEPDGAIYHGNAGVTGASGNSSPGEEGQGGGASGSSGGDSGGGDGGSGGSDSVSGDGDSGRRDSGSGDSGMDSGMDSGNHCGDGVIDQFQGEQCDGKSLGGENCASLGYGGGQLLCTNQCTYDIAMCTMMPDAGYGL